MNAVIIGRNYTSLLGMIRAVGMTGCEITVIRTVKGINNLSNNKICIDEDSVEAVSKFVKQHYFVEQNREILVQFLIDNCKILGDKVALLPVDDFAASTIDLNQDILRDFFVFPNINNSTGAVVQLMDKRTQKELARNAGLNVASGWVINISDRSYVIPEGITYPVFTKPEISYLGNKRCMKKCNNEKELISVIETVMKERPCPLLVEQYINIEKEYAVLGCSFDDKVYIPDLIHMLKDGSGPHKGVTMIGEIFCLDQEEEYVKKIKNFISRIGFTGLFDIDLYEANGCMYFNELNLRFGASGYALTASGINLPELLLSYFYSEKAKDLLEIRLPKSTFINEKVIYEDYYAGYISSKEKDRYERLASITFIKSIDDPNPDKVFRKKYDNSNLIKQFRRIIRFIYRKLSHLT